MSREKNNKLLTLDDLNNQRNIYEDYTKDDQQALRALLQQDIEKPDDQSYKIKTIVPRNELERNMLNSLKNDKKDFIQIANEKVKIAEFDKKMKRIKNIKSRSYRKHLKMSKKRKTNELEVPDHILENISEQKKEKAFYNEEMAAKVGKIMKIDLEESESTDSECDLMKNDSENFDDHLNLFNMEKKEIVDKDKPKEDVNVLPGWGNWGGRTLETIQTSANTIKTFEDGIAPKKRKDFGLSRVIINEKALENNIKVKLPYGFTKSEYEAWLNIPVTRQAYSHKIFDRFIKKGKAKKQVPMDTIEFKSNVDDIL
ncbi:putative U3 small nucleolar RNA-associated protein 14 [Pseudoloma neurophilia]|uniref:Putative U3 small nucleolar RNA-associated protein 14 n=1 Tax=Pseudoloma neurophilia TaxID=146866 RepID=A0A0R0M1D6_9MICR|nr:putative U3 small nucleolar RNA-associated protein 14 [Pseudoloma neurophilia]